MNIARVSCVFGTGWKSWKFALWFRSLLIASVGILMLLDLSEATAQWFFQKSKDEFDDTSMYLAISYSPDGSIGVSCR